MTGVSTPALLESGGKFDTIACVADPRIENFGVRVITSDQDKFNAFETFAKRTLHLSRASDYHRFRLLAGLVEGSDLFENNPLEYNFDLLNSISFEKGCYIGQELTARTKYKV